ncbi:MAG: CGNR zinc finger domain-containing protein [Solirubrobacterales bacterium]|nr:CGNR zinc finger domain-containing protein [Solirubrobacterales bacterium]
MDTEALIEWIDDKPAPFPLLAVQAVVNSYESEDEEEKLTDPDAARDWLAGYGLASPAMSISDAELDELLAVRENLRALIDANATGEREEAADAELAAVAARHPVPVAVGPAGDVGVDLEPAETVDRLIAQLIGVVMAAQIDGSWQRLKICAADTCRWAFYDSSKNRGGHWCSMEVCGNRVKNRAYRARHAATS